jgi:hypothetical protein
MPLLRHVTAAWLSCAVYRQACENNLAEVAQLRPPPHAMTPVPEILLPHSSSAENIPMCARALIFVFLHSWLIPLHF